MIYPTITNVTVTLCAGWVGVTFDTHFHFSPQFYYYLPIIFPYLSSAFCLFDVGGLARRRLVPSRGLEMPRCDWLLAWPVPILSTVVQARVVLEQIHSEYNLKTLKT